uniref:Gem-associated protein 2 n=1 Tax=Cacopsylla melanoneura TaxID=428564 RepID=A0A8D8XI07_9HEMI
MSDSSNDECIEGAGKFIKIAAFNPKDIDLSKPPTTGEEFLQRVILEKKSIKSKSVKIDRSSAAGQNDVSMEVPNNEPDIDRAKLPSKDWQNEQIQVFTDLRTKADGIKQDIVQGRLSIDMIDHQLFEEEEYCDQLISTHQPTQSLLSKLNQVSLDSLLEYLSESLESSKSTITQLGRWIYAVMVYLETPLVPEMHHSLRTIAKYCHSVRIQTDSSDEESLAALNLFITLISIYFGQTDLGDTVTA